jgi:hypothetical protein
VRAKVEANLLRPYTVRVECIHCFSMPDYELIESSLAIPIEQSNVYKSITCNSAIVYETDIDFGK